MEMKNNIHPTLEVRARWWGRIFKKRTGRVLERARIARIIKVKIIVKTEGDK